MLAALCAFGHMPQAALRRRALLATCPRRSVGARAPCSAGHLPQAELSEVLALEQARIALRRLSLGQVARLRGGGGADVWAVVRCKARVLKASALLTSSPGSVGRAQGL